MGSNEPILSEGVRFLLSLMHNKGFQFEAGPAGPVSMQIVAAFLEPNAACGRSLHTPCIDYSLVQGFDN